MKCPFKSSGNIDPECDREDCGVWDQYSNHCAIVAISQKLISDSGYSITETIDRNMNNIIRR